MSSDVFTGRSHVPVRFARMAAVAVSASRPGRRVGFAALFLAIGCQGLQPAVADGDTRILSSTGINVIKLPEHYGLLSPILHVVPLQLLAYHTALARGSDVDKPRNLAKSVTVE